MRLGRDSANKLRHIIDDFVPPALRDQYWFMIFPFKILFGTKAKTYMSFKKKAPYMTKEQFAKTYEELGFLFAQRDTDLNEECLKKIKLSILGKTILEGGCGKGLLAKELSKKYQVTACDIVIDKVLAAQNPSIEFVKADIEVLPFNDRSFDTVVCTHTLEHVQDAKKAIMELRRVTKRRLIIIVPMQRPYQYTFDLHLNFFPYPESLLTMMGGKKLGTCKVVGGDLFYIEDRN